jgi:hypothetical protein
MEIGASTKKRLNISLVKNAILIIPKNVLFPASFNSILISIAI